MVTMVTNGLFNLFKILVFLIKYITCVIINIIFNSIGSYKLFLLTFLYKKVLHVYSYFCWVI